MASDSYGGEKNKDIVFLFDVDGTLSPSRQKAPESIMHMLHELKKRVNIGFVGGSNLEKQAEQIGDNVLEMFDYGFPENGLQFYKEGKLVKSESFIGVIGETGYKEIVNKIMHELSLIDCPKKRGNFIELRDSMLNVSPIGRTCTQEERDEYFKYDKENEIRKTLCKKLASEFEKYNLSCVIGGQISIDIFPRGWDKTYCLNHIDEKTVVFFGDMTEEGGNDYEIYSHERTTGINVAEPDDTINKVNEELKKLGIQPIS
ncbi:phosphomannomutase [Enteropsectra breve]|nr:phosphomannomutase [Enteropsectra breve]